jgi:hypothetical protein
MAKHIVPVTSTDAYARLRPIPAVNLLLAMAPTAKEPSIWPTEMPTVQTFLKAVNVYQQRILVAHQDPVIQTIAMEHLIWQTASHIVLITLLDANVRLRPTPAVSLLLATAVIVKGSSI